MYTPTKMRALVGLTCLAIASSCILAEGKSFNHNNNNRHMNHQDFQRDPILALPTNDQPSTTYEMPSMQMLPYLQPPQAPSQDAALSYISPTNYKVHYYQEPSAQQPSATVGQPAGEQPATEMRAQEVHYLLRPENQVTPEAQAAAAYVDQYGQPIAGMDQLISVQNAAAGGDAGEMTKSEYPGEIIYLGQNGELNRFVSGQQELSPDSAKESLSNLGGMISGSSGAPATILTEVPARDMPQQLLDKLKREYGIKVVATREYPGANLVINCDDDSSNQQGGTICAKQVAFTTTSSNAPYSLSTHSVSGPSEENRPSNMLVNEQPNYATIENFGSRANQESPFGPRNLSIANEEYNTNARAAELETLANGPGQSHQVHPSKVEGQQDSDAGFDVQSPSVAGATAENMESKKHEEQ